MKAMLACKYDPKFHMPILENLDFMASAKLDGIRALVGAELQGGRSRSGKHFRNPQVHAFLQEVATRLPKEFRALDGELIYGEPFGIDVWGRTSSAVMGSAEIDIEQLRYYVFDAVMEGHREGWMWEDRFATAVEWSFQDTFQQLAFHEHEEVCDETFSDIEAKCVEQGYEGLMLRKISGYYKHGRSTPRQGLLVKVKRWDHAESRIVGMKEQMHNMNRPERRETGIWRSSKKAGLIGLGVMGALELENGVSVGTGFTDDQRHDMWQNYARLVGKICRYKHMPSVGDSQARHPVFVSIGDK